MTEQDFLKFHSGYFGEPVDQLGQIARICFTGEELFEYMQDFINQTSPVFEVKVLENGYDKVLQAEFEKWLPTIKSYTDYDTITTTIYIVGENHLTREQLFDYFEDEVFGI